jgi:hypothetical protein
MAQAVWIYPFFSVDPSSWAGNVEGVEQDCCKTQASGQGSLYLVEGLVKNFNNMRPFLISFYMKEVEVNMKTKVHTKRTGRKRADLKGNMPKC